MHEKYRFFSLYIVQKSPKFFCNGLKNFAIGKKKHWSSVDSQADLIHCSNELRGWLICDLFEFSINIFVFCDIIGNRSKLHKKYFDAM